MKNLINKWRKIVQEGVYSNELHSFIQYAYELDELPSYQKLIKLKDYLQKHFTKLGSGIERTGYMTNSGEVIKLSKPLGVNSNKRELERFNRQDIDAFPRFYAYDNEDYMWFVVEKVNQIGKENTWEKYRKLFPKLFDIYDKVLEIQGYSVERFTENQKQWRPAYVLVELMEFFHYKKHGDERTWAKNDTWDRAVGNAFKISPRSEDSAKIHKIAFDAMNEYLKNPDRNFKSLRRAVEDAEVEPSDFHFNNLGYDDNWNVKILDAG